MFLGREPFALEAIRLQCLGAARCKRCFIIPSTGHISYTFIYHIITNLLHPYTYYSKFHNSRNDFWKSSYSTLTSYQTHHTQDLSLSTWRIFVVLEVLEDLWSEIRSWFGIVQSWPGFMRLPMPWIPSVCSIWASWTLWLGKF